MLLGAIEKQLAGRGISRSGEARILVACSGGADSVALAHAAVELYGARRVVIGHVDHAVRLGSELDRAFVERFARALGASLEIEVLPPGSDDEARLREERYAALERMRLRSGAERILTAHTADDQAETILIALLRATHAESLRGMPAERGAILRPLLGVSRAEVRRYATQHVKTWRDDPSNLEPRYLRNRIRKELLPLIERVYRPGFGERLAALAHQLETAAPRTDLEGRSPPNRKAEPKVVPREGSAIRIERAPWSGGPLPDGKRAAVFDAAVLAAPIVRPVRAGDRVRPFGMFGTRKLQDVFVDQKVPRDERTWVWVVASGDEVVWVPGLLRSAAAPVGPETREVWIFTSEDATLKDGS